MVAEYSPTFVHRLVRCMVLCAAVVLSLTSPATRAVADPGPVYLRDLPSTPTLGQANKAAGKLYGATYSHAIVDSPSTASGATWQIVYDLGGQYAELTAQAGVADGLGDASAVFSVTGDGKKLYPPTTKHSGDEPCLIDVDVSGVQQLVLTVGSAPGGSLPKVVWADPQLLTAPSGPDSATQSPAPDAGSVPVEPAPSSGPETPIEEAPVLAVIAVIPFRGVSGDFPDASGSVTSGVNNQLGSNANVTAVDIGRVKQTMNGTKGYLSADDVRQVAQLLGAQYIVMGSVNRYEVHTEMKTGFGILRYQDLKATVAVDGELWDGMTGARIKGVSVQASKDEPLLPGTSDAHELLDQARNDASKQFVAAIAAYLAPSAGNTSN